MVIFLVCPDINLKLCARYLGHYSTSKFCPREAAMEEIYPFNEHNKTIFYVTTFMIYHNHFKLH